MKRRLRPFDTERDINQSTMAPSKHRNCLKKKHTNTYTGWLKKIGSLRKSLWLEQQKVPKPTPDSWLRYSKFSARSTGWLAWATLKTLLNSSHVLLWYTWSAGAFAFTQTAYLLKLVIPTTNALSRWMLNVETKTKLTLYSSRQLNFNEFTNVKKLVLHSSHFALNWRCCTALGEHSSGGIWKFRTSSFKCYVDHSHTMYISGNIDVRNWVRLF